MTQGNPETQLQEKNPQPRAGLRGKLTWGFVDQLFSSITNFGLSLFAGRLLGVSGLGVIAIGFSAYLIVLSFQRALVSEPLVVVSASQDLDDRRSGTRSSISATAGLGLAAAAILALLGQWVGGAIGRGLLIFAPWLVPALIQDLWRTLLFRDDRGRAAAANDAAWLVTMSACLLIFKDVRSEWAVAASWGIGAVAGSILGFGQLRSWAASPRVCWRWLRKVWSLGRWFAAENTLYTVASQAVVFLLLALVGAAAVGGLRAAQAIFAPLSLLWPAIALPGLPLMRDALEQSHASARRLALRLDVILLVPTVAYLFVASLDSGALLSAVFGHDFAKFDTLMWPVGAHQLMSAAAGGYSLLLKTLRRGKSILLSRTFTSAFTLILLAPLSLRFGIVGGAWAMALGTSVGTILMIIFALRRDSVRRGEAR